MGARRIVWFSCGVPSACAAKLTVQKHPDAMVIYCDVSKDEDADNIRFRSDVERWIGKPVQLIKSEKFDTVDEVFAKERYMSGPKGARCTTEMKKIPRLAFQQPDDIHIFGFAWDEMERRYDFERRNPELNLEWPLFTAGLEVDDCLKMVQKAGIAVPRMYLLGFEHNNCWGCVKSSSPKYWNLVRRYRPDVFERRATRSRELGCRLVMLKGQRIFLDELPPEEMEYIQEKLSCGPECGQVG